MPKRFEHRDDFTVTTVSATRYPYAGPDGEHGVQLALRRDHPAPYNDEPYQVARLPRPDALRLARWILATYKERP
jgi:hypothetical protein